jgi:fumarylacetoacetate (FAA) hydrolase
MKLVTFTAGAGPRPGVLCEDADVVLDLSGLAGPQGDMIGLIERAEEALPAARALLSRAAAGDLPVGTHKRGDVKLLAPVPRPVSMRDGYAFRQHVEAARRNRGLPMIPEFDLFPVFYYTNHLSVIGPGEVVVRKGHLDRLDFELEAAVVLGRGGRDLDVAEADRAIFGLMVMNDWSARGLQMEEMKLNLGPAKGKDFATALGPYLVPVEDLAAFRQDTTRGSRFSLRMRAELNGALVSQGDLGDMSFTFAEIIARASYGVTLYPGEVIGSGTVGTGCLLELNGSKVYDNLWLKPGDVVVCEVQELGRLENVVVLQEPGP